MISREKNAEKYRYVVKNQCLKFKIAFDPKHNQRSAFFYVKVNKLYGVVVYATHKWEELLL